jgi:DNA-directed RNA polymerase specialized sigma24 family protein
MNCHFHRGEEDRTKSLAYAMPADFCKVFDDDLDHLYTLSLLLTADHGKADQCFVSGLQDCLQANSVFQEWAQSWARRTVIKNAVRLILLLRHKAETPTEFREPLFEADSPAAAITSLQPFERFVYVLSVLEKYSDRECSMLLECTVGQVIDARARALQQFVGARGHNGTAGTALTRVAEKLNQVYGEAL